MEADGGFTGGFEHDVFFGAADTKWGSFERLRRLMKSDVFLFSVMEKEIRMLALQMLHSK